MELTDFLERAIRVRLRGRTSVVVAWSQRTTRHLPPRARPRLLQPDEATRMRHPGIAVCIQSIRVYKPPVYKPPMDVQRAEAVVCVIKSCSRPESRILILYFS